MFELAEIARFRREFAFYDLDGPDVLQSLTDEELQAVANGVGPDRYPASVRKALNALAGCYTVISVPHDVRYEFHVGTQAEADSEFYCNALKIHAYRWGWRRWISVPAWKERVLIWAAYKALQQFGDEAWEEEKEETADV